MPRLRRPQIASAPGRARNLTLQTAQHARRAKAELVVIVPLLAITLYCYLNREEAAWMSVSLLVSVVLFGAM